MRKASLGTIVLTVFLDLLGFGLVVPYLPGVARAHGASDLVATMLGAAYSLMQLLFVPFWGQLSDRIGRRPMLLASIAASCVGMVLLGSADSLFTLFAARIWSGMATANIAVAQAYIADVTRPEERARGMGLIGAGIGLGFVVGPVFGGLLESHSVLSRPGAMPAFAAAALSAANFVLAVRFLPESLGAERRARAAAGAAPTTVERLRAATVTPGLTIALVVSFVGSLSFAGLEQTFRLFTADEFSMSVKATGYLLGLMGLVLLVVQGGLIRPLARFASDRSLLRIGLFTQALGFSLFAGSPSLGESALLGLQGATVVIAFGSALTSPSLSAYVSRSADSSRQGSALGVLQSAGALARVCGPAMGGLLYQFAGHAAPYAAAAAGMLLAGTVSLALPAPGSAAAGERRSERDRRAPSLPIGRDVPRW